MVWIRKKKPAGMTWEEFFDMCDNKCKCQDPNRVRTFRVYRDKLERGTPSTIGVLFPNGTVVAQTVDPKVMDQYKDSIQCYHHQDKDGTESIYAFQNLRWDD